MHKNYRKVNKTNIFSLWVNSDLNCNPEKNTRKNQENYTKSSGFQVNDFVYLDFDEKLFDKSFNVSVSLTIENEVNEKPFWIKS